MIADCPQHVPNESSAVATQLGVADPVAITAGHRAGLSGALYLQNWQGQQPDAATSVAVVANTPNRTAASSWLSIGGHGRSP